jgi:tripartite-type tricarboxylate transporter receptor subunit TctC
VQRRHLLTLATGLALSPLLRAQAAPLRVILPVPPGGPSDSAARALMQVLGKASGRTVVLDNKPGAGGALAARALMDARPDGQTVLWTLASMTGIPLLQKTPPFQSLAEFTPVGVVGRFTFAMFVPADSPARSVAEFVAQSRAAAEPPSCGHGTLGELMAAAQFLKASGARAVHVPYKGGAQLMPDLSSGRLQLNFGPVSSGLALTRAGKLRALAVLSDARSPVLPEVPTLAELGITTGPLPTWQALMAPAGTPPELARALHRDVATALRDADLRAQLDRMALQADGGPPEALGALVRSDIEVWRSFVREHQIAPE